MKQYKSSFLVCMTVAAMAEACGGGSDNADTVGSNQDDGGWEDDGESTSSEGASTADAGGGAGRPSGSSGPGAGAGTGPGAGTGGGSSGNPGAPVNPAAVDCTHVGQGTDYQVGPGKAYENIGDVPFESLVAGDTVRIFWREQSYHEKMMIGGVGTGEQPIRVCGVAGPQGQLPVIDGQNATTRPTLDFPFLGHQARGLVIVGHPYAKPFEEQPSHILIEALEIRNASPEMSFTDKAGVTQPYSGMAAGIFVQRADDLTIRGCDIHDNNNGVFMGTGGGVEMSHRVLVEGNRIYENGSLTDWYEHNIYNEVDGVIYQFNYLGEPRAGTQGVLGSNIKDRSAGVVVRYNWIEDGGHLLDIVDAQEAQADTVAMPSFHETFVYGNVLIRSNMPGGSMIHYGGDSGIFANYRKGTLHFYENTLIVKNATAADYDVPEVFEISTNEEQVRATNNIFYSSVAPGGLKGIAMLGGRDGTTAGVATFTSNWVSAGWSPYNQIAAVGNVTAQIAGLEASLGGTDPGFTSAATDLYTPAAGAAVIGAGADMAAMVPAEQSVQYEYVPHQAGKPRAAEPAPTIGAMAP